MRIFLLLQSLSKKRMLHKARARNARPYGHGGVMRSYFFFRNIVGARIARPLLEFVQNFGFTHLLQLHFLQKKKANRSRFAFLMGLFN